MTTILLAFSTGALYIKGAITSLEAGQTATQKALEAGQAATQKALEKLEAGQVATQKALELQSAKLDGLPRAFNSIAAGVHQAAADGPVSALAAASRDGVAAWLTDAGFAEYVPILAPFNGAALLLQTPASLQQAGVKPVHAALLMEIIAAAYAPPSTGASGAP